MKNVRSSLNLGLDLSQSRGPILGLGRKGEDEPALLAELALLLEANATLTPAEVSSYWTDRAMGFIPRALTPRFGLLEPSSLLAKRLP